MQEKLAKMINSADADAEPDSPPPKKSVKFADEVEEDKEEKINQNPKTPWQKGIKDEKPLPVPNTTEALPEGFFDDPKVDAKVRKAQDKF